ncbi:U-box domain-containing protein 33 [Morella rubra]|uniref:RING-type E3 ubiquitin transferase n=1 Tax=Morella rubra TaxID=262757 RepID=A0A6A1VNB8_9ROSI|nr:U-box domain-containing protein 33 [Morella rubra]
MGSILEFLDHPLARATDDHIAFVAVGKDVRESELNLLWALQNCGRRRICILHVHRPEQRISVLGGKVPISSLNDKKVKEHQKTERQAMQDTIRKYLSICGQRMVQKLVIEMDSIEQGIVELLHQHGIKHLVMGAAADRHYSKNMAEIKSAKAKYVHEKAPTYCCIQFICKGNYIFTRRIGKNREGSTGVSICDPLCSLTRQTDIPSSLGHPKEQKNDDIESDLFSLPSNHSRSSPSDQEIMITPTIMQRTLPSLMSATEASASPETGRLNRQRSLIFPLVHKYGNDRERGFSNTPFPIDHPTSSGSSASCSTTGADVTRDSSKEKNKNVRLESDLFSLSLDDSGRPSAVDFASPSQEQRISRSSLNTDEGSIEEQEFEEALAKEREEHVKVKTERDQLTEALRLCQEQKMSLQRQNVELQRQRDQLQIERNHALKQVERLRKKQARRDLKLNKLLKALIMSP